METRTHLTGRRAGAADRREGCRLARQRGAATTGRGAEGETGRRRGNGVWHCIPKGQGAVT